MTKHNTDRDVHQHVLTKCYLEHNGIWPAQLESGVMFYHGERITYQEFRDHGVPRSAMEPLSIPDFLLRPPQDKREIKAGRVVRLGKGDFLVVMGKTDNGKIQIEFRRAPVPMADWLKRELGISELKKAGHEPEHWPVEFCMISDSSARVEQFAKTLTKLANDLNVVEDFSEDV